jgi:hypothetical protein
MDLKQDVDASKVAQTIAPLACIEEVSHSNHGHSTNYPDSLCGFPESLQVNAMMAL